MTGQPQELSRTEIQAELSRIQRRAILTMVASLGVLVYSAAVSPLLPSGPAIVPAVGLYLSDLPELPLIAGVFYLIYLSLKTGKRKTALQAQLTKLAVAETASGAAPPSLGERPGALVASASLMPADDTGVAWFPNRTLQRVRVMSRIGAAVLVAGLAGILLLIGLGPHFGGPWRGWAFSWLFTGLMFGIIMLGVGASSTRTEPRRIGVSSRGAHRELPKAATDQSLAFIPWTFVESAQGQGSNDTRWVTLKTLDRKAVTLSTNTEGAESLLTSYEAWKARSLGTLPGASLTVSVKVPAVGAPPRVPPLPELAATDWHPNSLRQMWLALGLFFLGLSLVLTPVLGPYALHPKTFNAGVYLVLAYFIAVIILASVRSFPSAVAVGPTGFLVRTGSKTTGLRFSEVSSVSAPGQALECTLLTGRTERFQSLGPREKREIQEGYRAYREGSVHGAHATPVEPSRRVWTKNSARWGPTVRFFVPLAFPVVVAAIGVPLFLSNPKVYFGFVLALPLAMLPAPFALFTIRAYRRAPSEVGLSDQGIEVRYPHHLYPAVALEKVGWADIEHLAGHHGKALSGTLGEPTFELSGERYLTFQTKSGVTYTLGPVSPSIETAILRRCPPELTQKDINVSEG